MRSARRVRGRAMLWETIVAASMLVILLPAVVGLFQTTFTIRDGIEGLNESRSAARASLDALANALRGSANCAGASQAVLHLGQRSELTLYRDSGCGTSRYWLDGTDLKRTEGGTTVVLARGVQSLTFTYYKSSGYNATAWYVTDDPHAPTSAELPQLAGVRIAAAIRAGKGEASLSTVVRLRNSPRKVTV